MFYVEHWRYSLESIGYCLDSHTCIFSHSADTRYVYHTRYWLDTRYDLHTVQLFRHGGGGLAALYCTVAAQIQKRAKLKLNMQRIKQDNVRV